MAAGLTKTIATLSWQGSFWKALEVYEALPAAGLVPDTPIANAALSASNRGTRGGRVDTPVSQRENFGWFQTGRNHCASTAVLQL